MTRAVIVLALCCVSLAAAAEWSSVQPTDRPITVTASGIITSSDTVRFGPPPSRDWRITITSLTREGTLVSKGDVLVQFDGSATDGRMRESNAQLNTKRSELDSLLETQAREVEEGKVRLEEARSNAEKAARKADIDEAVYAAIEYRKLVEERRIAEDIYRREQARSSLVESVRVAQRSELEAEIRRLESELAGAKRELESFNVRAPRDGLVIVGTDRQGQKLDVNDSVNPGIVVVELANPDALVVQAEVPEFAATKIAIGQQAKISIDTGGTELDGTVVSVGSIVRQQSQFSQAMVRDVNVTLPEASMASLRPGMSARVTIVVDTAQQALAVPEQAIRYRDGKPGVVVRNGGWQPVVVGQESAGMRIVTSGLDAGAEIQP